MSNKNKALKAGIGYTIGNYFLKGLSFLTIPIFTRLMSTGDYGKYNTYLSYEALIFIVLGFSFHASLKNAKYKYGNEFKKYVSCVVLFQLISLLCWLLVVNLLYSILGKTIGYSRILVNLLLLYSFSTALIQVYNAYLGLEYRYSSFLKISGFNAIANILISMILILTCFSKETYIGRIIGTVIPSCAIAVYILYEFWKNQKPSIDKHFARFAFSYSIPIIPHGLAQVVLSQFDRIMISTMEGNAQAGIYSFAYNIYSIVFVTTSSTDQVWGPWFYEKMNAGEEQEIKQKAHFYAMGIALFIVAIILISPEVVVVLGSKEYQEAMYTVIPVVASGYFAFLYTLPVQVEYYYSKTKLIALGTTGAALINIILNYFFIKKYGYVAAAYTTLITYILYFCFHLFISYKIVGKLLYSVGSLVGCSIVVLLVSVLSLTTLRYPFIRWGIVIILGIVATIYVNKKVGIIQILDRLKKH
ncbi:MAG: lipopolysaccharide biosynthesis protein [Lachnospiraceae bacterium]